jgi:hypothetical protein
MSSGQADKGTIPSPGTPRIFDPPERSLVGTVGVRSRRSRPRPAIPVLPDSAGPDQENLNRSPSSTSGFPLVIGWPMSLYQAETRPISGISDPSPPSRAKLPEAPFEATRIQRSMIAAMSDMQNASQW